MATNFNPLRFIIGAVILAAGFIPSPLTPFLQSAGIGMMLSAFGPAMPRLEDRSREMDLNRYGTEVSLPVVYGLGKVSAAIVDIRADPSDANKIWVVAAFCHGSQDGSGVSNIGNVFFDDRLAFEAVNGYPVPPFLRGGTPGGSEVSGTVHGALAGGEAAITIDGTADNSVIAAGDTFLITGETGTPVHTVLSKQTWTVTDDPEEGSYYYSYSTINFDPPVAGAVGASAPITFTHQTYFDAAVQLASLTKHLGTSSQTVDSALTAAYPTNWPSTAKGQGICYAVFHLTWDENAYTGLPAITAEITGNKVWDPRDSTWKYSDNPALVVRDYLTSLIYGLGAPSTEIDDASFIAMANHCDELVSIPPGGTQKRYRLNGWVDTSRSPQQNLADMLTSCRGFLVNEAGKYRIFIRRAVSPVSLILNADNIIGDWQFTTPSVQDAYNLVWMKYLDPAMQWQVQTVAWPEPSVSNTYLTDDNGYEVRQEFNLPYTIDRYMAQQIGMATLKESRSGIMCMVTAKEEALSLQIGDVVRVDHATPGWSLKPFWVLGAFLGEDLTVRVALAEYDSNAYVIDAATTAPASPATWLPSPFDVREPATVTLLSDATTYKQLLDGTVIPRIKVSWTLPPKQPFVAYVEVQARQQGTINWTWHGQADPTETSMYVDGVNEFSTWEVWARCIFSLGGYSTWVKRTVAVTSDLPDNVFPWVAGRQDLIFNGIFEDAGLSYWKPIDSTRLAIGLDTVTPYAGSQSMKISTSVAKQMYALQCLTAFGTPAQNVAQRQMFIRVFPGQRLRFHAALKINYATPTLEMAWFSISQYDQNKSLIGAIMPPGVGVSSQALTWGVFEAEYIIPANVYYITPICAAQWNGVAYDGFFDDLHLWRMVQSADLEPDIIVSAKLAKTAVIRPDDLGNITS